MCLPSARLKRDVLRSGMKMPMNSEMVRQIARPFLLAIKAEMTESYGLSVLDTKRLKSVVLESVTGPDYVCFNIEPGTATPAYTSAPGKAFFAHLPEKQRLRLLPLIRFKKFTAHTLTTRKAFEAEIERIRKQGYATDRSEEAQGCHCGGVAILNSRKAPVAALWVSGMAKRLSQPRLLSLIRVLQKAAGQIEAALSETSVRQPARTVCSACVRQACALMTAHIRQPISHDQLAQACRVSYSTLRTLFLRETGSTPGQYALNLRLEEARRLLAQTALPITEIATQTGFCNQKHFSAMFKRKTGVAPMACRRQLREGKSQTARRAPSRRPEGSREAAARGGPATSDLATRRED